MMFGVGRQELVLTPELDRLRNECYVVSMTKPSVESVLKYSAVLIMW